MQTSTIKDFFHFLRANGIVWNTHDFAEKLGYSNQYVEEVLLGVMDSCEELEDRLNKRFRPHLKSFFEFTNLIQEGKKKREKIPAVFTGEDIKKIRTERGVTQSEFADRIGITRELLSRMETNTTPVSPATNVLVTRFLQNVVQETPDYKELYYEMLEKQVIFVNNRNSDLAIGYLNVHHKMDQMDESFDRILKQIEVNSAQQTAWYEEVKKRMNQILEILEQTEPKKA